MARHGSLLPSSGPAQLHPSTPPRTARASKLARPSKGSSPREFRRRPGRASRGEGSAPWKLKFLQLWPHTARAGEEVDIVFRHISPANIHYRGGGGIQGPRAWHPLGTGPLLTCSKSGYRMHTQTQSLSVLQGLEKRKNLVSGTPWGTLAKVRRTFPTPEPQTNHNDHSQACIS